jgi:exopolysaccharide production protein ExoY
MLKRIFDLTLAMVGLILVSPLFLACILLTHWRSGRPIFFKQDRLGKDGKIFKLWKFRTMKVNTQGIVQSCPVYSKIYAKNFKIPCGDNNLVTRWGRIMRKTSIDELPQLINVLQGDMSIVGPRPIVPLEIKKYGPYGQKLLSVKPGLTGYWQVSGRNKIGYPDRVFIDMYYIDHQSLAFDVNIIAKTFWVLLTMEGSM